MKGHYMNGDPYVMGALAVRAIQQHAAQAYAIPSPYSGAPGGADIQLPPKPGWREGQLAEGVYAPRQGRVPLPMLPQANNGVFTATQTTIFYKANTQKPFRVERVVSRVARVGTSAANILVLCTGFYVGTDPQIAQIGGGFDVEIFAANAFDVEQIFTPATPGVDIATTLTLSSTLTSPDTITPSLVLLGKHIQ